jgi:hypothetical protein
MTPTSSYRGLDAPREHLTRDADRGRMYVVVIGIDRYRAWGSLHNAVRDATGALDAFQRLGFELARPPLIDDAATGDAIRHLVTDELRALGANDSLVVFFAGHGHTVTTRFADDTATKQGYLIPFDAEPRGGRIGTWLSLRSWLAEITHLPPKHILVILDACHSGVALDPVIRWRGSDVRLTHAMEQLRARRSRRVITSALDDQLALDSGPLPGHSLFTGCLIQALTGGMSTGIGPPVVTGSELGLHVQRRVAAYPNSRQTPDFGALELDDRGELIVELPGLAPAEQPPVPMPVITPPPPPDTSVTRSPTGPHEIWPRTKAVPDGMRTEPAPGPGAGAVPTPASGVHAIRSARLPTAPLASGADGPPVPAIGAPSPAAASAGPVVATAGSIATAAPAVIAPPPPAPIAGPGDPPPRGEGLALDPAFVAALDRHDAVRRRGGNVLSIVAADPMTAVTGWAAWAAGRGWLTLVTEGANLDAAIADLLGQAPWLRMIPAARARLAAVTQLDAAVIDAEIDRRSRDDREAWIEEVAGYDPCARVGGWLLSALREPWARVPELTTAPVQGAELLSIFGELAAPIAVLVHHPEPTAAWLERAIRIAAGLVAYLPRHAVAVSAPGELTTRVMSETPESAALSMARHGVVPLAAPLTRTPGPAPRRLEQALHDALARDPRTANLFALRVPVPTHDRERAVEVALLARAAMFAVEIDDWYHLRDPKSYHRERVKDVWLQRAGFFVARFLADDVEGRLARVVDEIALGIGARRAAGSFMENS